MIKEKDKPVLRTGEKIEWQRENSFGVRRADGSFAVYEHITEPSMCHQEFAEECDINNLMRRYTYAQLPDIPTVVSSFSQMVDYHDMMNEAARARQAFDLLPGELRQRFGNNPQELIEFLNDEKNRDEAVKLGLVNPKQEPKNDPVLEELRTLNKNLSKEKKPE